MKKKNHKYIFVVGGVMSGVGNGNTINGAATLTMNAAYRQRKLRYTTLTGVAQWIVIGGIG
jgi:hypothetical protein